MGQNRSKNGEMSGERAERVAVVPGSAFGPSGAGHVRMCYATSYEQLQEALRRIGRFVERSRAA